MSETPTVVKISPAQVASLVAGDTIPITIGATTFSLNPFKPSADGATVIAPATNQLTDSLGNIFGINSNKQVVVNGTIDTSTANVVELAYKSNVLWQKNASQLWWKWSPTAPQWTPIAGTNVNPLTGAAPTPTPTPTPTPVSGNSQLAAPGAFNLPQGAMSIYTNGKFNWPGDWSWGTPAPKVNYAAPGGLDGNCVEFDENGTYSGWQPYAPLVNGNPELKQGSQNYLCLSIKPTKAANWQSGWMQTVSDNPSQDVPAGATVNLSSYAVGAPIEGFQAYKVPLGTGGYDLPAGILLRKFMVQDATGDGTNVFSFDRVYLSPN